MGFINIDLLSSGFIPQGRAIFFFTFLTKRCKEKILITMYICMISQEANTIFLWTKFSYWDNAIAWVHIIVTVGIFSFPVLSLLRNASLGTTSLLPAVQRVRPSEEGNGFCTQAGTLLLPA